MCTTERAPIKQSRRWVIKIGSALLTNDGLGLDEAAIADWVDQLASLNRSGIELVLVSSGSIAEGMARLHLSSRPREIFRLQAAAAVGQMGLIQCYERNFKRYQLNTAQILLTHDDLSNRERYLNARGTLRVLVDYGVVPVINENDTVVTEEIRFGDNDTLGALVTNLVEADLLVILTDQDGLFNQDPRLYKDASLVSQIQARSSSLEKMAGGSSGTLGQGGMLTKVRAARMAARSGAHTVIANGRTSGILHRLRQGEILGTLLVASQEPILARKQWLAGHLQAKGELKLDQGAVTMLCDQGKSLLAVGVTQVNGSFSRGEMVRIKNPDGKILAHGLINYNTQETVRILGQPSHAIEAILGYVGEEELVHRDNLVLL